MNRYELAHYEVSHVLSEHGITPARRYRMANAIVDSLVAAGIIQSTEPGDLVPGGLDD